jgi:hypothetical protein
VNKNLSDKKVLFNCVLVTFAVNKHNKDAFRSVMKSQRGEYSNILMSVTLAAMVNSAHAVSVLR